MIKMQEEFKKHDQLMENEIKLLKEEVQTLKVRVMLYLGQR